MQITTRRVARLLSSIADATSCAEAVNWHHLLCDAVGLALRWYDAESVRVIVREAWEAPERFFVFDAGAPLVELIREDERREANATWLAQVVALCRLLHGVEAAAWRDRERGMSVARETRY
jgi:hypothetical protein